MISVVIATYNGEAFIRKQLDSILKQSVKADEIIICDDGSTDNTLTILDEYAKKNDIIKIVRNSENLGYAMNFWNGIHLAQGDYIFLSDQDDVWHKDKISIMLKTMVANSKILSLNTAYKLIDGNDKPIDDYKSVKFKNDNFLKKIDFCSFIKSPRYPGMSMAIRKELLKLIKETEKKTIHSHDWFLNHTAAFHEGMFFLDKALAYYRQHGKNTYGVNLNTPKNEMIKRRKCIVDEECELCSILRRVYKNTKYSDYMSKQGKALEKRKNKFEQKKILGLMTNYIFNFKYLALRGLLGDVYVLTRR